MHHRPSRPPLRAGIPGAVRRWARLLRWALRLRVGRLLLGGLVTTAVTAFVLAVPVVSHGDGGASVALDSSTSSSPSRSARSGSPVVMGEDGQPLTAGAFARAVTSGSTQPSRTSGGEVLAGPGSTGTHSSSAAGSGAGASGPGASGPGTSAAGKSAAGKSAAGKSAAGEPTGSSSAGASSSRGSTPGTSATGSPGTSSGTSAASKPPASTDETPPAGVPAAVPGKATLLELVNERRAGAGCAALVVDGDLDDLAREHSISMRDRGYLGIADPEGVSVLASGGRAATVAQGDSDAAAVLDGWLADPASGAPLLDCDMTSIGVGLVRGGGGPWWTALLS